MRLGYDPETTKGLLVASPEDLRKLASLLEAKLKTTKPGEDLTVLTLKAENIYTGNEENLKLDISATQFE